MTWPAYHEETGIKELDRFRRSDYSRGAPAEWHYTAAVDVWWCPNGLPEYMWRSYADGVDPYIWGMRKYGVQFGPGAFDDRYGFGALYPQMSGIEVFNMPGDGDFNLVGGVTELRDLAMTVLAVAQGDTQDLDQIPHRTALVQRMVRSPDKEIVIKAVNEYAHGGIFVRIIARRIPAERPETATLTYRATLEPRDAREHVNLAEDLKAQDVLFEMPEGSKSGAITREAKIRLGISGHPAKRIFGNNIWHLQDAAWQMTIEPVDESTSK